MWMIKDTNYLAHYGVPNQQWGKRRYQYEDGSLTPEGREHYGYGDGRDGSEYDYEREKRQRRRQIARGIAIGAGVALAAGGAYALYKKKHTNTFIPKPNAKQIPINVKDIHMPNSFDDSARNIASKVRNSGMSNIYDDRMLKKNLPALYNNRNNSIRTVGNAVKTYGSYRELPPLALTAGRKQLPAITSKQLPAVMQSGSTALSVISNNRSTLQLPAVRENGRQAVKYALMVLR